MITIDELASRLEGVRNHGNGFVCCCPAHDDDKPSLSVSRGTDGRILIHCHAGCSVESVASAIGVKMSDLMPDAPKREKPKQKKQQKKIVATYDYQGEDGKPIYRVIRYEPKDFRQAKIGEDGKLAWNMAGVTRVPYHLPEVIKAAGEHRSIVICEGEKDVDNIRALGITATCNAGGAGKWDNEWNPWLVGSAHVYIIADKDSAEKNFPGQRHAWNIHLDLDRLEVPHTLLTVPNGKDATDYILAEKPTRDAFIAMLKRGEPWPKEWCFDDEASEVATSHSFGIKSLADFPPYQDEAENRDILIKGRWLERGGSAFWISTAGTGKSIITVQLSLSWSAGLPFAGLTPNIGPLKIWIIQSEDSPSRVTIDREDVIAELTEQHPDVDWREIAKLVKFVNLGPRVGADFLTSLESALAEASQNDELPDIVILNPFLAYIGGPITDGSYVTPFLRGGEIMHIHTKGLQAIEEEFNIAVLAFHHTPKPPTDKELDGWMKSAFPEYQGAGSSDITNWGRSFITMMKVKGHQGIVMLTAGKNGSEIGWSNIDGANRHYLAWSKGRGITGKSRHAWRELDEDERKAVVKDSESELNRAIDTIVSRLKETPMTPGEVREEFEGKDVKKGLFRVAWKTISDAPTKYGIFMAEARLGRGKTWYFGLKEDAERCAHEAEWKTMNGE